MHLARFPTTLVCVALLTGALGACSAAAENSGPDDSTDRLAGVSEVVLDDPRAMEGDPDLLQRLLRGGRPAPLFLRDR